jgi:hypothetical protein
MRTTAKQISLAKPRCLYMRPTAPSRGKASPKFRDFYQDFLIDGYMAAI